MIFRHVHLIGIGGTGLSAIGRVLLERGLKVSGSDRIFSSLAEDLATAGAEVYVGHRAHQVEGAEAVVRSSAVPQDNVEVLAALQAGIPVYKRVEFLPYLLENQRVIAVAGTHGKTTTTAMIASLLQTAGRDPSFIIGSVAHNLGVNAHAGQDPEFVIEADEYDYMFLGIQPWLAVVTSIEHDHPDCFPEPADYRAAFEQFGKQVKPDGLLLVCSDDPGAVYLAKQTEEVGREVRFYGIEPADDQDRPDYYAVGLEAEPGEGYQFQAMYRGDKLAQVKLGVPGRHNVSNALAALATAHRLGLDPKSAAVALNGYKGTERRFSIRGEAGGVLVIDDYAHHPTEVKATLEAAQARYPGRRIWAVWQPHTYSRTRTLLTEFRTAFVRADRVMVLAIYAAREAVPKNGFDGRRAALALEHPAATYAPDLDTGLTDLQAGLRPGDVVLVMSAGDATQLSERLLAERRKDFRRGTAKIPADSGTEAELE